MGAVDKLIARVELQAETLAEYRQLDDRRRSRITELERKLGDAEREQDIARVEIETLRQERDLARAEIMTWRVSDDSLRKDRDHWKQARQDAIEAGELMQAEIETLRQQLDAAQGQLTRERLNADEQGREIETLRQQLANAQQEASDEFAERQVLQHEASDDYVELERLRAFVEVMRGLLTEEYADQRIIAEALDELDAGTPEPVPVAEPLDPDTRDQELERLRAFVAKAREPRQRRRDEMDFQSIPSAYCNRALDDLGTPEPAQVTEPLDAEGGA